MKKFLAAAAVILALGTAGTASAPSVAAADTSGTCIDLINLGGPTDITICLPI